MFRAYVLYNIAFFDAKADRKKKEEFNGFYAIIRL
jgi:hypothetical protein